jgi:hypothetical protein
MTSYNIVVRIDTILALNVQFSSLALDVLPSFVEFVLSDPGFGSSIKFKETPCPMKKNGLVLCTHYTLNATAKDCMGIKFYNKLKHGST